MEDAFTLVVLTLLQLCRAEIINTEWYAANLINDPSYTPKPITEIFTTDLTFVPKNPALAQSTTETVPSITTSTTTSSTTSPTTTIENRETTTQEQAQRIPLQIVGLPQQPQIFTQSGNDQKGDLPSIVLIYDPSQQTSQIFQRPLVTSPPTSSTSQTTVTETAPTTVTSRPSTERTTQTNTQGIPIIPRSKQPQTILLTPPQPSSIPTYMPGQWDIGNIVNPIPNVPFNNSGCNSTSQPNTVPLNATQAPQTIRPGSGKPVLTVRLKTPKGSITNIRINPTTTTRRPSTTRRRKSNKRTNDYEICLNSCDGKKEPICSSPAGISPIDPEKLKGFSSLCHMACHNSFRKDQVYDKVADGRCGRLRTRIRPVDKKKLTRDELHKAQYTITHNAPETIMEFTSLKR